MEGSLSLLFPSSGGEGAKASKLPLRLEKENTLSRRSVCRHVQRWTESSSGHLNFAVHIGQGTTIWTDSLLLWLHQILFYERNTTQVVKKCRVLEMLMTL